MYYCTGLGGNNPLRYQLAGKLGKEFVDNVLARPNNRIGLVTFGDGVISYVPFTVGLSNDAAYLKRQIGDSIDQAGNLGAATCTCCAIRMARKILEEQGDPAKNKYIVLLSDGITNYECSGDYPTIAWGSAPGSDCCHDSCGLADGTKNGYCDNGWYPYELMGSCDCAKAHGGYFVHCKDYVNIVAIGDATEDACAAKASIGEKLSIYSIGMYSESFASGCPPGKDSLDRISSCGKGKTFIGTSTSELEEIFNKF